jgi:hypothetical protein
MNADERRSNLRSSAFICGCNEVIYKNGDEMDGRNARDNDCF